MHDYLLFILESNYNSVHITVAHWRKLRGRNRSLVKGRLSADQGQKYWPGAIERGTFAATCRTAWQMGFMLISCQASSQSLGQAPRDVLKHTGKWSLPAWMPCLTLNLVCWSTATWTLQPQGGLSSSADAPSSIWLEKWKNKNLQPYLIF